jgi:threonine/homoserine/homoserine lactone efflux protein
LDGPAYLAFIAVSMAVIVVPGPSVLLIVANTLKGGARAGLFTVAGTSIAMAIQLVVAVAGLTSLVTQLAAGQQVARWLGIAYLAYLGVQRWRKAGGFDAPDPARRPSRAPAFGEGFLVSLTNPTTMLFFVAFFPQFLTGTGPPQGPLQLMAASFWGLALAIDCLYTALAASISAALDRPRWRQLRDRCTGVVLLVAAGALALARVQDAAIP